MMRSSKFAAVIFLAGLMQAFSVNSATAQNHPWEFSSIVDPITDLAKGRINNLHADGGFISLRCTKGAAAASFLVWAGSKPYLVNDEEPIEIAWRIDNTPARNEVWLTLGTSNRGGAVALGASAVEFALAIGRAQERIVFRDGRGTVVFGAKGSTKAVAQLLDFCGIKP